MGKVDSGQYRFDVICARDNGISLVKFCRDNGISVNSMINHLIVSFLLNKNKYAFNFVDKNELVENQVNNQQPKNNIYIEGDEDNDNFPDIIKELLEVEENEGVDYSF